MKASDYRDMKDRLRKLLERWGLWTTDEIEEVAQFVQSEIELASAKGKKNKH